jgi:hypothetical protein
MFKRRRSHQSVQRKWAERIRALPALIATAAAAVVTTFSPAAFAQSAPAPKHGLYLYVCTPGNNGGDLSQGGEGLLVLKVDENYRFVERIPVPYGPNAFEGGAGSCKGLDASIQTGLIYPMMTDRLVAIDLETSKLKWTQAYDGHCCDRGSVSPFGETIWQSGNREEVWYVVSAANGALIKEIKEFPARAHNTQMSPRGDQVLLSPANDRLYLYDTRKQTLIRELDPFFGRNRPFVVNGDWTRVYANNNGYLGFTAADIQTGRILYRLDAPGTPPCQRNSGGHGACVHGLAMTHDETAMWFPSDGDNGIYVYNMNGKSDKPTFRAKIQDHRESGWITCGIDGTRMYPASGTVFDTNSLRQITRLRDEAGRLVYSEKMMEVRFENGKVVQIGDQWCNGLLNSQKGVTEAVGRTAPGYQGYKPPGATH